MWIEIDESMHEAARKASNFRLVEDISMRPKLWNELQFDCVKIIDRVEIPELKRRGFAPNGEPLPYPYEPGENPDSLATRIKRWWYYAKQSHYDDGYRSNYVPDGTYIEDD